MSELEGFSGSDFLAEAGLNLQAVFDCAALPEAVLRPLRESGVPVENYTHLVLLGHGGRRLWDRLQAFGMETADPVDHYSLTITYQYIERYLNNAPHLILYPLTDFLIPLTQLGELAGWSQPAPIGLGINPTYGVWFAYRVAFLVSGNRLSVIGNQLSVNGNQSSAADHRLPITGHRSPTTDHPCTSCADKPCLAACPAHAVQPDPQQFDIFTCVRRRLESDSSCADRCLARLACPVAPEHRYSLAQIRYHYGQSLITIRKYMEDGD